MDKSNFVIAHETEQYLYIVDTSVHFDSITNTVESVLSLLYEYHNLGNRRLIYRDSDGQIDEILHINGVFIDFAPGHHGIENLPAFSSRFSNELLSVHVQ